MKITVWYLLVICLIKVKEMVNYIFAQIRFFFFKYFCAYIMIICALFFLIISYF